VSVGGVVALDGLKWKGGNPSRVVLAGVTRFEAPHD